MSSSRPSSRPSRRATCPTCGAKRVAHVTEDVVLRIGARRFDAEIKSENCVCVPPEHEHYHLICPALKGQAGFKSGALVVIAKDSDGGYRFVEERG